MKLQARIIWISCMSVLIATLMSDAVLWTLNRRLMYREALESEYRNVYEESKELHDKWIITNKNYPELKKERIIYLLKQTANDYIICFWREEDLNATTSTYEELYNHTVLTMSELKKMKYTSRYSMRYTLYKYDNKEYYIFEIEDGEVVLYYLKDISYVRERTKLLALGMLGITVLVLLIASIFLFLFMRKAFSPLKELSSSAKSIADGNYEKRIEVRRQDEIGELADNFNHMAEAVEQRTHSLEESELKKTLFMGNLTHELKTPMTAISGYAETLLMTKLEPEEEEEALRYIYSECGRLERLSKKMMKLLELEQDTMIVRKEYFIKELFVATAEACSALLRQREITLRMEEHGEQMSMDMDLMTDVLVNFVDNAIKASSPGSEIVLYAGMENDKPYIVVEDHGCGIPKEEQEKIMEPFYMVDKSRSRKNGGAGLGLALAKLILEKHEMHVIIESKLNKGTRVYIKG